MLIGVVPDLALRRRTCYEPLVSTHPDTQGFPTETVFYNWEPLGETGNGITGRDLIAFLATRTVTAATGDCPGAAR